MTPEQISFLAASGAAAYTLLAVAGVYCAVRALLALFECVAGEDEDNLTGE